MNRLSTISVLILITILLTSSLEVATMPSMLQPSSTILPSADAFSLDYHKAVTDKELGFLKPEILAQVDAGHHEADDPGIGHQFNPAYHFDDCNFQEGTEHINEVYTKRVIPNLDPKGFGVAIHAAMDFYAHTNWVEMGRTDLIDDGKGPWKVLHSGDNIGGVIVLEGDLKGGILHTPTRDFLPYANSIDFSNPKVPIVTFDNGKEKLPGLISGVLPFPYPQGPTLLCPTGTPNHWDSLFNEGSGLNKDKGDGDAITQALILAHQQVRHEWCRLVNLVEKTSGEEALDKLIDSWVDHPEKAPCMPTYQGSFHSMTNWLPPLSNSGESLYNEKWTHDGKFVAYGGGILSGTGKDNAKDIKDSGTTNAEQSVYINGSYDANKKVAKVIIAGIPSWGPPCSEDPNSIGGFTSGMCEGNPFILPLLGDHAIYDQTTHIEGEQFHTHIVVTLDKVGLSGEESSSNLGSSSNALTGNTQSDETGRSLVDNVQQQQKTLVHDGITQYNQGNFAGAVEQYDKALQINANDARIWYDKGLALAAEGKFQDAIDAYDDALKIDANYADAFMAKGIALANLGKYGEAIQSYYNALQLRPNDASIMTNIGSALNSQGRYQEAIQFYDKALQIEPNHVNALIGRGTALAGLGRYQEAIQFYDKALQIEPSNSDAIRGKEIAEKHQQQ